MLQAFVITLREGLEAFLIVAISLAYLRFTLLMISREGIETAVLLLQLHEKLHLMAGAVAGVVGAAFVAWLWPRYGHRVNLSLFFQVTAVFLFVFLVQLVIRGVHEMAFSRGRAQRVGHLHRDSHPSHGNARALRFRTVAPVRLHGMM